MNSFRLDVMTPSKHFYGGDVDMVIVTTKSGDEGFMAGHVWGCKLLEIGELWILEKGGGKNDWRIAAVAGGFVEMKENMVIYTDAVEWSEDIDMERALSSQATAEDWLVHNEETAIAENVEAARSAIARAKVRVVVAKGSTRH